MQPFIDAIKANDLVKVRKAFGSIMSERTTGLVEARKKELASMITVEGEERNPKDDIDYDNDEVEKTGVKDPDADAAKDKKEKGTA